MEEEDPATAEVRSRYHEAVRRADVEAFYVVVLDMWRHLAEQEQSVIQPLFESAEAVLPTVKYCCASAFKLERWALTGKGGLTSGGNMLLQGVKGVGKTTLMQGLKEVFATLSTSMVAVYIDYQQDKFQRPRDVLVKRLVDTEICSAEEVASLSMKDVLSSLRSKSRTVVFFGDEVQELYNRGADVQTPQCQAVVELLVIGKTDNSLGVIAGSTSALRSLVFRHHNGDGGEDPYANYPDLNNTVYTHFPVKPLRSHAEVAGVLRLKHKLVTGEDGGAPDDAYVSEVFRSTGGVGRVMDSYSPGAPVYNGTDFITTFGGDQLFCAVMSRVFVLNNGLVVEPKPVYDAFAPQRLLMHDAEQATGRRDIVSLCHGWVDAGLMFVGDTGRIEFACAAHFDLLYHHLYSPDGPEELLALALRTTLLGWRGEGSGGAVIERHILKCYADTVAAAYEQRKLTFAATDAASDRVFKLRPDVEGGGGAAAMPASARTLGDLDGVLFDVAADKGLDGFILSRTDGGFDVHAFQIKTGELSKRITSGTNTSTTDTTMGGILRKACKGAEQFRAGVAKVFEGVPPDQRPTLVFRRFTLITTKTVEKATAEEWPEYQFGDDTVTVTVIAEEECFDMLHAGDRALIKGFQEQHAR